MENLNPKTSKEFDLHQQDIETRILKESALLVVPPGLSKADAYAQLMQKIEDRQKIHLIEVSYVIDWNRVAIGIAASLLLAIGIFWFNTRSIQVIELAQLGEQKIIVLPDGSKVSLNSGSKIEFSKNHFIENRSLSLSGEAFFEVKKGTHFQINTPNGKVEILGTSLDVFSRNEQLKVTCLTGKVKVSCDAQVSVILPGESVEKQDKILIKKLDIDADKNAAWRVGEFHYRNAQLIAIFAEIERQFNVSLEAKGQGNRSFTGSFSNKNLQEALDIICIPMGLNYEIRKNKVFVQKNNH